MYTKCVHIDSSRISAPSNGAKHKGSVKEW